MRTYLILSLLVAIIAPIITSQMRATRGLFVHIGSIFFFQAIGALALSVGFNMLAQHSIFWAWFFFSISLNSYIGSLVFVSMARKHHNRTIDLVIEEIRRGDPTENVLLEKGMVFWPVIFFPYPRGSQAAVFTGRRWVNGIKASFGFSKITLTNRRLLAQLIFPSVLIIEIRLSDIESIGFVDKGKDLVGIRYRKSRISPLTKLLAFSGTPGRGDIILINVGGCGQRWLDSLAAWQRNR